MDQSTLRLRDPAPPPHGERRRTVRQKLHTPVYVSFNGPQSGMVVDLSELLDLNEHGFAVQTAAPTGIQSNDRLEVNRAVTLCLDLPETKKFVHGSGQVMWTDDTGRAGIRFSFLPDGSQKILKEWLFANLLIASSNHAARVGQLSRRQQEESSASELPVDESRAPELTPMRVPEPPYGLNVPAAPPERAELLSTLDDLRRQVREIEARQMESLHSAHDADAVLHLLTEHAMSLTGAAGAALALLTGGRMLCRARVGDPAPPLGSEVDVRTGLSGECIRGGVLVTCEDPETDPRVDAEVCRMLGIGSFMAAPIFADFRIVGLLEIFAPRPHSFTSVQGTILERLVELVPKSGQKPGQKSGQKSGQRSDQKKTEINVRLPAYAGEPNVPAPEPMSSSPAAPVSVANRVEARAATAPPRHAGADLPLHAPPRDEHNVERVAQVSPESLPESLPESPPAGESRFFHLGLLGSALAVVAMVLGYLLAPMIEKRWLGPPQSSPSSSAVTSQPAPDRRSRVVSLDDLRSLANHGDADAQWQLGVLCHNGEGVPQDDAQAVQWFQRAADQGYVRAESTLGAYYWAGRGVPQDFSKAYFWSQLALAQGDENSKSRLEGLAAQMTRTQVASARQQAEAWLHSHNQGTKGSSN